MVRMTASLLTLNTAVPLGNRWIRDLISKLRASIRDGDKPLFVNRLQELTVAGRRVVGQCFLPGGGNICRYHRGACRFFDCAASLPQERRAVTCRDADADQRHAGCFRKILFGTTSS